MDVATVLAEDPRDVVDANQRIAGTLDFERAPELDRDRSRQLARLLVEVATARVDVGDRVQRRLLARADRLRARAQRAANTQPGRSSPIEGRKPGMLSRRP